MRGALPPQLLGLARNGPPWEGRLARQGCPSQGARCGKASPWQGLSLPCQRSDWAPSGEGPGGATVWCGQGTALPLGLAERMRR